MPGGFLGVNGFFVIMGFLMVYTAKDKIHIRKYYSKKLKRLYPSLLAMLALTIIAMLIWAHPAYRNQTLPEVLSIVLGYNNWYQVAQNGSYFTKMLNASPMTHLWYMGLTVQYYVLWPLAFLAGTWLIRKVDGIARGHAGRSWYDQMGGKREENPKIRVRHMTHGRVVVLILVLALACISALMLALGYQPGKDPSRLYYGTDTRAFALLLGIGLGIVIKNPGEKIDHILRKVSPLKTALAAVLNFLLLGALLWMYLKGDGTAGSNYHYMMQVSAIIYALIIICVFMDQMYLGRVYDVFPLKLIGKYSYEIYLVMYPVIWFTSRKFQGIENRKYVATTLLLIVVCAGIVHIIGALLSLPGKLTKKRNKAIARLGYVLLLTLCIGVSTGQSIYVKSLGGNDDIRIMQQEIQANEVLMENEELVSINLTAQLATVTQNVDTSTSTIEKGAAQRKAAADAAAAEPAPEATDPTPAPNGGITAIGDSVMLGAAANLKSNIPGILVNAKVGRQVVQAPALVKSLADRDQLGSTVIVHLGTNGEGRLSSYLSVIDSIGPDRRIYWVTVHGVAWAGAANANIRAAASQRGNVHVIDWDAYASSHASESWFYSDGIHLQPEARRAYTELIKSSCGL